MICGEHPPAILVEALGAYHAALQSARADAMKSRETPPTPPARR